jgi:mRNA interferase MazF
VVVRGRSGERGGTAAHGAAAPPSPHRGDVHWVTFAQPVGRRPVLVIQNDAGNRYSANTIVAHVSAAPRRDYPFLVALDAAELGKPSWVHCESINTIPSAMLEERLGSLSSQAMSRVDEALKLSLGLA